MIWPFGSHCRVLLWQLQEENNKTSICANVGWEIPGLPDKRLSKAQTFKMAFHIWYPPRVSSEASYPQNGRSSCWDTIFPFWTILPNSLNLKIIGDVGCFFLYQKTSSILPLNFRGSLTSLVPSRGTLRTFDVFSQPLSQNRQPRE